MDTTKAITHIGLCAGYRGIELGLQRAIPDLRTVALCEIEAFAIANLVSKMEAGLMDPAPIWPNLKTFPWESFRGCVDILTGGYPCQPFSAAGKRQGADDPRHLWPYIARGIRILQPRLCFFENVEGHISLGLSDVIEDLAEMGYRTTWGIFSASEVGAPHQRKRVFILAIASSFRGASGLSGSFPRHEGQSGESDHGGHQGVADTECGGLVAGRNDAGQSQRSEPEHSGAWPSRPGEQQYAWEPPRVVGDTESRQDHGREPGDMGEEAAEGGRVYHAADSAGEEPYQWQAQPPLGGDADGSSGRMDYAELCVTCDNRTDELRLLGNGVVPHTAELAFRVLIQELANE
jgi:DNA (cytosine-5)-methyltransferase 1